MLILSRNEGERIYIDLPDGRRVIVAVVEIERRSKGKRVRLGFQADDDIRINREEVLDRRETT